MRKLLMAVLAAAIFSLGTVAVAAVTAPPPASLAYSNTLPDPAELTRLIGVFEARVSESPSHVDLQALGGHYFDRAALTGDLNGYRASLSAYERAVALAPNSQIAQMGLARSAGTLHRFSQSLAVADAQLELDKLNTAAWLLQGDALLELGDVDGAEAAFTSLPADHPATIVRAAEIAHLRGDQDAAVRLAAQATDLAVARQVDGRNLMFYLLLESDLLFDAGDYETALDRAQSAISLDPTWAVGYAGQAKVLAGLGRIDAAKASYEKAMALQSGDPGWTASLGDLEFVSGNLGRAAELYAVAEAIYANESPELTGRSLAVLWADRGIHSDEAVQLAKADLDRRQDIGTWDAYGWALYRSGDYQAAREAADQATRLGIQDGELQFHSAMIWAAVGDTSRALAEVESLMARNPAFHPIHRYAAQMLLDSLTDSDS
jgi:tetratricopeptide (TPR) repeat protein